ncbi:DUF2634 domain-containing protein [Longirhabdus pacifica]|uniref:DUF2634 domain-containing protein n=1 Tax=Longirhabdus pacifica TaxID=2305227 RepID=UPI0010090FD0|nr:DUF2634 domain-containing protein [Longirhabdus pacifica]
MNIQSIQHRVVAKTDIETNEASSNDTKKMYKSLHFDFDSGELQEDPIEGLEAVKQMIRKTLVTDRYRFIIYDDQYGSELQSLIGTANFNEVMEAEVPRFVKEALLMHEHINDIYNFNISRDGDAVYVAFHADSTYGTLNEEVTLYGI